MSPVAPPRDLPGNEPPVTPKACVAAADGYLSRLSNSLRKKNVFVPRMKLLLVGVDSDLRSAGGKWKATVHPAGAPSTENANAWKNAGDAPSDSRATEEEIFRTCPTSSRTTSALRGITASDLIPSPRVYFPSFSVRSRRPVRNEVPAQWWRCGIGRGASWMPTVAAEVWKSALKGLADQRSVSSVDSAVARNARDTSEIWC